MPPCKQARIAARKSRVWVAIGLLATIVSLGITLWLATVQRPLAARPETDAHEDGDPNLVSATAPSRPAAVPAPIMPDPDSVEGIVAALESPDKSTRTDAIERAKQIEDRSVTPVLQAAAEKRQDPEEKADLLAAIDFINLPSFAELEQAQRANRLARGLPLPAQASVNRYTGKPFRRTRDGQSTPSPSSDVSNPSP